MNQERMAFHELLGAIIDQDQVMRATDEAARSELLAFVGGVCRSIRDRGVWPGIGATVIRAWRPGQEQ